MRSEHEKQQKVVADDVETLNIIQTEPTMTSFSTQTSITESRSAGTQWIDPTLHEHEYARPCISVARDTGTQTKPSERQRNLANRFGISESYVCTIFNQRFSFMASKLKNLIVWLPHETIKAAMPKSFRENYPKTTVIIDCAETFIQRAKHLKTRGETYSHYKSNNTGKNLVGIAPHGQITIISKGFGGRSSDKAILEESDILNYLLPGDEIMADRGFTIDDLLFLLKVKLNIPAFTKGKDQLSEEDVTETRRIATVRIHVERAIRRLKVFCILSQVVPVTSVKKLSDYLIVCAALVNLRSNLIKDKDDN
ncbi:uncharacterized protein LOC130046466 [Ostrea edulis]|uniref:uncharacterized protein LOC130046466 n=1 Tax=Ostrea edulis TaxID=37623 RepID=UPI0024AFCB84|nr:uncharacterized protein LOC130046466 [Ostrea edulis]